MFCRLYVLICKRKLGMTLSGLAYLRARRGRPFWRNRIDGFFLLFLGRHSHCQASFQRHRAPPKPTRHT